MFLPFLNLDLVFQARCRFSPRSGLSTRGIRHVCEDMRWRYNPINQSAVLFPLRRAISSSSCPAALIIYFFGSGQRVCFGLDQRDVRYTVASHTLLFACTVESRRIEICSASALLLLALPPSRSSAHRSGTLLLLRSFTAGSSNFCSSASLRSLSDSSHSVVISTLRVSCDCVRPAVSKVGAPAAMFSKERRGNCAARRKVPAWRCPPDTRNENMACTGCVRAKRRRTRLPSGRRIPTWVTIYRVHGLGSAYGNDSD